MDYLIGELIQVLESLQNKEGVDFWDAALWLFGLFIAPWLLIWRITRWNAKKRYQSTILQGDELRASLESSNELVREQKKQIEAVSAKWTTAEAKLPDAYLTRMKAHKQQNNWSFEPAESHDFITAQAPALHLAFSTLARKAVEDSIEDGPAAIENAHMFASAAVAVDPQDRLSRMLVDELAQGWDGIADTIKIPDNSVLAANDQQQDRIAKDLDLIESHIFAARDAGAYNIMEKYALHGQRMASQFLGEKTRRTLWFSVLKSEAMRATGHVQAALDTLNEILPDLERLSEPTGHETIYATYLAALYLSDTGRAADALDILTRDGDGIMPLCEKVFGHEHPHTLASRQLAASCLKDTGRAADALVILTRDGDGIMPLCEKVFGHEHPHTLASRHLAASCLIYIGRAADALVILTRNGDGIIPIHEKVFGHEHPHTLASRQLAASCLKDTGRAADALDILTRDGNGIILIQEKILGHEHPETLLSRRLAVSCLLYTGRAADALDILTRDGDGIIPLYEKILSHEHPSTLKSRHLAAACLLYTGRAADALDILTRDGDGIIPIQEKILGPEHPHTLTTRSLAAHCYIDLAQPEQAEKIHRGVLKALLAKNLTKEHPLVQRAREVEALLAGTSEKAAQTQS